jgi:hypothetical protein
MFHVKPLRLGASAGVINSTGIFNAAPITSPRQLDMV